MAVKSSLGIMHVLSIFMCMHLSVNSQLTTEESSDGKSGTIKFTPPQLDDEETFSVHLPQYLKCDACYIIAHKFKERFMNGEKKRKGKRLLESEVIDLIDDVCTSGFGDCGIKVIKGVKRLSGPGVDIVDTPGMMQGGGRWPDRLQRQCESLVGELGEDEIYDDYFENKDDFTQVLCHGSGARNSCTSKEKKEEL